MKQLKMYTFFLILLFGQITKLLHLETLPYRTEIDGKHLYYGDLEKKRDDFDGYDADEENRLNK
jgi:hypothetical protein